MDDLRHLFPKDTATAEQYTYAGGGGGEFKLPPRDRVPHSTKLVEQLREVEREARTDAAKAVSPSSGTTLEFASDPEFALRLESLEVRTSGIELRNARVTDDAMHATVFVPEGKAGILIKKVEDYGKKDTKEGTPKNRKLVESIASIKLATLRSFWMDSLPFPDSADPRWWEVWLRDRTNPHDVVDEFRRRAQEAGVLVGDRVLRFPERCVVLASGTKEQLLGIENLFDVLAELRAAKVLAGEFLALAPRDQAEFVEALRSRLQPALENAPAVCHLDTGVNRGHPLLESALEPAHCLSVEPAWTVADNDGHGTEMAGLALFGCLTSLLDGSDPVVLRHRLESVKILPDTGANDPDLYGDVTSQAVSRIEIVAPNRTQRAFCLTITSDGRDEGPPSSWSAAVDQITSAAGEEDASPRLLIVSAGNVNRGLRHEYPDRNYTLGVEDPAHAWNALTVGAFTERVRIDQPGYEGWTPIAPSGALGPASRTSLIWPFEGWPLKPDIVMEGGNNAIDPSTGTADNVDDLLLLTTRVAPTGALLTTSGETSAAAALAARYGAIVWSEYPNLWAESVRGVLVHSARWTGAMMEEFPYKQRRQRLCCYGYGVPNLKRALASASNAATLVVEGELQPFKRVGSDVKTKDLHLHNLPWPTDVLRDLGDIEVSMRVTLSYFIEPSPGERGWKRKHRYQSHGLRFEVKRPTETADTFRKRINAAARAEGEGGDYGSDARKWEIGPNLRSRGSVHSDRWTGTAAELAACGQLAVFPVTGWWRERPHLGRFNAAARYSLIVSLETPSEDVDLYTPISNAIDVPINVIGA